MKRILLSLSFLILSAGVAFTANAIDFANTKQPVQSTGFSQPVQGIRAYKQQLPLRGNTESKIYHASDCEYYNSKAATAEFATIRQAESAGFRACKICEGKEGVASAKKQQQASSKQQLHGNPASKTLHGPSCKFYNAKSSTETFSTVEQAKKQGYHLCTICEGK